MRKAQIYKLESAAPDGVRRFCGDVVSLAEGKKVVTVTVTRTGKFYDPRYGEFEITPTMLDSMVSNFKNDAYGQKIVLDVSHNASNGAAGFFQKLFVDRGRLRGQVELTKYGIEAIKEKGFIYVSAEFHDNFVDNEARKEHGPTLLGAGLTPRPVIKHLDPIQLSEETLGTVPTYLSNRIEKIINEDMNMNLKELMAMLRKKLGAFNLAEHIMTQLINTFEGVAKNAANEDIQMTLMEAFVDQGKILAEELEKGNKDIKLDFSGLDMGTSLSADDVAKMLAEHDENRTKALAKTQESLNANVEAFTTQLSEAKELEGAPEDLLKTLGEAANLITATMTHDQVKSLAMQQIALGQQFVVQSKLQGMGYNNAPAGSVHLSVDDSNNINKLQQGIIDGLKGTSNHANGLIHLSEKLHPFCEKVLGEFDRMHAPQLHHEAKLLAGGESSTSDTSLPVGFQRTVIREALSDTNVLQLVQTLTDFGATGTTNIPYETRDTSNVTNDGVVYEGNAIHRASVSQEMDLAYILPMKIAFLISNEVMHFTRASAINWDAYARNVESNARVMRELVARRICNELQRAADAYNAVDILNEDLDAQLTGSVSTVKTAQFPIVRQHQQRDLKGNAVGAAENAITIQLNGVAINEYNGTNTQSAGTYYRVTNYNLGYVQFVSELGAAVTPAATAGADDISYSYATNVEKFDLDNGSTEIGKHLNGLLRAVGNRKALMSSDRFVLPNFGLMSPTLNNTITNADNFEAQSKRDGSNTNNDGDLEMVKGVSSFGTNAPGIDMGDERMILGQRGVLTYTIAKPFVTKQPFEAVDSNGNAIGKMQAYGEEYSAIKVPTPIRNRLTSVLAYSVTGR